MKKNPAFVISNELVRDLNVPKQIPQQEEKAGPITLPKAQTCCSKYVQDQLRTTNECLRSPDPNTLPKAQTSKAPPSLAFAFQVPFGDLGAAFYCYIRPAKTRKTGSRCVPWARPKCLRSAVLIRSPTFFRMSISPLFEVFRRTTSNLIWKV